MFFEEQIINTFQRYKVVEKLDKKGANNIGIYKAFDLLNNQYVAIKKIKKSQDENLEKYIKTEVEIMKKINELNNPNLIFFIDYIQSLQTHYIITEFCNNGDLETYIKNKKGNKLEEQESLEIIQQLLNAFKGLHQLNIMHRDIKLANIFIQGNYYKVGDLGYAKIGELAESTLGTPYNIAPEVYFFSSSYNNKADLWSLGVILYQMIFGSYPFPAKNKKELEDMIKNIKIDYQKNGVYISDQTQNLLKNIFIYDPQERISWSDFIQEVQTLLNVQNKKEDSCYLLKEQPKDQLIFISAYQNLITQDIIDKKCKHIVQKQMEKLNNNNIEFYRQLEFQFNENSIQLCQDQKSTQMTKKIIKQKQIQDKDQLLQQQINIEIDKQKDDNLQLLKKIEIIKNQTFALKQKYYFQRNKGYLIAKVVLNIYYYKFYQQPLENLILRQKEKTDTIIIFVLFKKLYLYEKNILQSLQQNNCFFPEYIEAFNMLTKQDDFLAIIKVIKDDIEILLQFFEFSFQNETEQILNEYPNIKNLIDKDITLNFEDFYSNILKDYIVRNIEKKDQILSHKTNIYYNNEKLFYQDLAQLIVAKDFDIISQELDLNEDKNHQKINIIKQQVEQFLYWDNNKLKEYIINTKLF